MSLTTSAIYLDIAKYSLPENGEKVDLKLLDMLNQMLVTEEKELIRRKMKTILKQEDQLGRLGNLVLNLDKRMNVNDMTIKKKLAKKNNNGYLWVTINPKPDIALDTFLTKIRKIAMYTCFQDYKYVIEQRGTVQQNNIGSGIHAHLLLQRNLSYKPKDCIKNIRRGSKTLVGNINNDHHIYIQKIGEEWKAQKDEYIEGIKFGDGKSDKQKGDIIFRKKHNLETVYVN